MPYSITRDDAAADLKVLRAAIEKFRYPDEDEYAQQQALEALADSIEEQVKPAMEEPTGDVVVFILGAPFWPREGGVHWVTYDHSNNPPTWGELVNGVGSDGIQIYRNEAELTGDARAVADLEMYQAARDRALKTCQAVRDRVGPSGMINASQIMGLLSLTWPDGNYHSPQSDATGALPTSPSPEVGVATSSPVASPQPSVAVLRTVADAVVAKRPHDGSAVTISDLVEAYNARAQSWREIYNTATKNTRERIYNRQTALKAKLITAPEQTAIDKALAEIEADVEDHEGPVYHS